MGIKNFTTLILIAGGTGSRMGGGIPKQFRLLNGKPLVLYSFELFAALDEIDEIVVVCDPSHHPLFPSLDKSVRFARPGSLRQESVYNGLLASSEQADLICVHDSARPFLQKEDFLATLQEARKTGAAALAVPATNTIKQVDSHLRVQRTLPRHELWELQTPQIIRRSLFFKAYAHAKTHRCDVTDDLSLIEALGEPATLVKGSPHNLKLTTPFDWLVAEKLLESQCVSS